MDTIKSNLRAYYNEEAAIRDTSPKQVWKIEVREQFYRLAKCENKNTLLELGAGAGYDSQFFLDSGMKVTAIDLSREMIELCKQKSIEAYEMDFYDLSRLGKSFDCIWSMNSLLHVPKTDLPQILQGIDSILGCGGLFYMGVYGGVDSEDYYVNDRSAVPRFFSHYTDEKLKELLSHYFEIISFKRYDLTSGAKNFFKQHKRAAIDFQSAILRKKI